MNSISIRQAIFLLFILTWGLAVANVKNVSYQGITPAKVFTNYLKVPWINLNSSWKDKVTSPCRDEITTLFESANAGEMWALQMLDAASKIPAGLFTGNIRDLGMYEECIRVKPDHNPANIQGRHCMVSMSMPPEVVGDASAALFLQRLSPYNPTSEVDLNFAASLCLPSTCSVADIAGLVNASIQDTPELAEFEVKVAQVTCSSVEPTTDRFTWGTILAMSFFAAVIISLIFCTVCGFLVEAKSDNASTALKTLAQFSLYTNTLKLCSTETPPGTIPAIHGIKFLSICMVVTIHRFSSTLIMPVVNLSFALELKDTALGSLVLLTPFAVDTFFLINGFLTTYLFLQRLQFGMKINVAQLYLHRYLRLAPCMAALLLFTIFILPHLGSGPIWETIGEVTTGYCRKNWWTNLLYIQNFVNREEMCMVHTWYTAVEMQLFWICPIILYPLFYRPKLGLAMLLVIGTVSFITPAIYLIVNDYSFLIRGSAAFVRMYKEFIYSYTQTYNRALPYFLGIYLGYIMANNKKRLTKAQATFNWILASTFLSFCAVNAYFIQPNSSVFNVAWEASYTSVGRLGWSLVIAWTIYACTHGHGGQLTTFLSLPIFVPLSRMVYGMYLVSVLIQVGGNATQQTAGFESRVSMMYSVLSDTVLSVVAGFLLNLFFESPVIVLEKILREKGSSDTTKHPLDGQKQKLVALIKQYPDLGNPRIASDLDIQARMPCFWRTVSDILNIAGKKSTKTPMEWLKTWQDWRANVSQNPSQRKNSSNEIRSVSAHLETGITTPEKELLIFLAAVSCGSDEVASFEQSGTTKPTKSPSDYRWSQNKPSIQSEELNSLPNYRHNRYTIN